MSKRSASTAKIKSESTRKRQKLIKYKYNPPSTQTLQIEFDSLLQNVQDVGPRQSNMEHLIQEWNRRMAELGVYGQCSPQDIAHKLNDCDLELMRQLTSLGRETLKYSMELTDRSAKCTDFVLDKLQKEKHNRLNEVRSLKQDIIVKPPAVSMKGIKESKPNHKIKIEHRTSG